MIPQIVGRQFLVYLAGPITGLSFQEATDWYWPVVTAFPRHILALKPLRGKTQFSLLQSAKYVAMRCYNDVDRSDGLLVNLLHAKKVSRGVCSEIGRAAWRKPIVVVMQEGNPHWGDHMLHGPSIVVPTLDEGIALIISLVSPV